MCSLEHTCSQQERHGCRLTPGRLARHWCVYTHAVRLLLGLAASHHMRTSSKKVTAVLSSSVLPACQAPHAARRACACRASQRTFARRAVPRRPGQRGRGSKAGCPPACPLRLSHPPPRVWGTRKVWLGGSLERRPRRALRGRPLRSQLRRPDGGRCTTCSRLSSRKPGQLPEADWPVGLEPATRLEQGGLMLAEGRREDLLRLKDARKDDKVAERSKHEGG